MRYVSDETAHIVAILGAFEYVCFDYVSAGLDRHDHADAAY